jgi:hypothetical protein
MGGITQKLALKEQELDREREVAMEMRSRLKQLNQTYLNSGACPSTAARCACCCGHPSC